MATERFGGAKVVTAGGGCAHSAAVTADGAVYTWGRAAIGLDPAGLGHDDLDHKLVPILVEPGEAAGVVRLQGGREGKEEVQGSSRPREGYVDDAAASARQGHTARLGLGEVRKDRRWSIHAEGEI